MPQSLEVYAFHDRRVNGFLPVYDIEGRIVAEIKPSLWTPSFGAMDADGALLCSGRPRGLRRAYLVSDAGGTPLLELRSVRFSQARTVVLADGRQLSMRNARWPSRGWAVTDDSDRVVLSIAAAAAPWRVHPDAYAVEVGDPDLSLAEVVGIVQANRALVKQRRRR